MALNYEEYWHYLDGCDMTDEQKREFLDTLYLFMQSFVDQAWGIDSVQLVMQEREKKQSRKKKAA